MILDDIDLLLDHDWEPEIKECIIKMKKNLKSYSFLLTKTTLQDISDVVRLANHTKNELQVKQDKINLLNDELILVNDENNMLKDKIKQINIHYDDKKNKEFELTSKNCYYCIKNNNKVSSDLIL